MAQKWVIFDADNTLWNVEAIYNEARRKLCEKVNELSDNEPDEIEKFQKKFDHSLKDTHGYSPSRFPRSFEKTAKKFLTNPSNEEIADIRKIAEDVFYTKAEIYPRLEEVLRTLRSNDYNLGIVTAGEEWVQRRRLEEFHLRPLFRATKVVNKKTKEKLHEFCKQNGVDLQNSYFVGDSVDSDVIPASQAGLKPVLLEKHDHWQEGESKNVPQGIECDKLDYVADLLSFLHLVPVQSRRFPRRVPADAIFEGGGAKGLAHVGVLKALEHRKFCLRRVAGTSAGAIVAGLCAAGYTADELFADVSGARGLLDFDYLEVLGGEEWQKAEDFIEGMKSRLDALKDPKTSTAGAILKWLALGKYLKKNKDRLIVFNDRKGYFVLDDFCERYNGWLMSKLVETAKLKEDYQGPVLFQHLPMDLYVISTDISGKRLCIHSKDVDTNESVADAVVASMAIPAVFEPRDLGKPGRPSLHVDGGMLSNFPAWLFATNPLRMDPGKAFDPIFGVELQDIEEASTSGPAGLFGLGKDLVSTAIAGSKKLETRDMRRLLQIEVPATVKSYEFNMTEQQRLDTYLEGKKAAERFFRANNHAVSSILMRPYLENACKKMIQELETSLRRESIHLRVNIMARVPPDWVALNSDWPKSQQIEVLYHHNMDLDPDVVIAFGPSEGAVGACYEEREVQVIDLEWTREAYPVYRMTAVQQAVVRRTLKSLMCIPMYDPNEPEITDDTRIVGILNFDSDENVLELFDTFDIKNFAMTLADDLAVVWYDLAEHGEVRNDRTA